MKIISLFVLLLSAAYAVADTYPHWINSPPTNVNNHIYAVGISQLTSSVAQSINAATSNAKAEVISQLRANISGNVNANNTSVVNKNKKEENYSSSSFYNQSTTISAEAKNITGISIIETYIDKENKTVFALADFDAIKAITDLKNRYASYYDEVRDVDTIVNTFSKQKKLRIIFDKISALKESASLLNGLSGVQAIYTNIISLESNTANVISTEKENMTFSIDNKSASELNAKFLLNAQKAVVDAGFKWNNISPKYIIDISSLDSKEKSEFYDNVGIKLDLNISILLVENRLPILSQNFVFKGTAKTFEEAATRLENSIKSGIADAIAEVLTQ